VTGAAGARTALVTGAAGGLGRVFAAALASQGIAVAGIDIADLQPAADAVPAAGGQFTGIRADLTDPDLAAAAVRQAAERLGRLDIVVNNAGVFPLVPFADTTPEQWRAIMSLNLDGHRDGRRDRRDPGPGSRRGRAVGAAAAAARGPRLDPALPVRSRLVLRHRGRDQRRRRPRQALIRAGH
jgi:NAD(P)-dependent dehydrogenase (short-subunit alcohol dehydrogenase family)